MTRYLYIVLLIVLSSFFLQSCSNLFYFRSNYSNANALIHKLDSLKAKPFLKAHLKNGDVCIMQDSWQIDTLANTVQGYGSQFDYNRNLIKSGAINLKIDSVALFETNRKIENPEKNRIAAMTILLAIDAGVFVYCITNPKSCYGSCPTFYLNEHDNFHYADAESFSNAILPSLEYADIDALGSLYSEDGKFSLTMKNEALETHCVNEVKLFAFPKNENQAIHQSMDEKFYLCENTYTLSNAIADEGDISSLLKYQDKNERFSLADDNHLSTREEFFLEFDDVNSLQDLGLIINYRQTMMTTYLIYNALAYMGDEQSDILAMIESNPEAMHKLKNSIKDELGNIDIYALDESNNWVFQASVNETGPIAINKMIVRLKGLANTQSVKLKIIANKGLWRFDYFALTNIIKEEKATEIKPYQILKKGNIDEEALDAMQDPKKYIISMPGNEFKFNFNLPFSNQSYDLFLNAKGYYLEWMRDYWLQDKNLSKLKLMADEPNTFLKGETKNYKLYEKEIESDFWNSKINTKTFDFYEK